MSVPAGSAEQQKGKLEMHFLISREGAVPRSCSKGKATCTSSTADPKSLAWVGVPTLTSPSRFWRALPLISCNSQLKRGECRINETPPHLSGLRNQSLFLANSSPRSVWTACQDTVSMLWYPHLITWPRISMRSPWRGREQRGSWTSN